MPSDFCHHFSKQSSSHSYVFVAHWPSIYVPRTMPTRRILFSQKAINQTDLTHCESTSIETPSYTPNGMVPSLFWNLCKDVYKPASVNIQIINNLWFRDL